MENKIISTVNLFRFYAFSFIIFFFILFAGTSFGQNTTLNSVEYLNKATAQNKHNIKTKVYAKNKTSLLSFNSSDLIWQNVSNKPTLNSPAWTFQNNNYNWKPSDKNQFIKIPLRQKTTKNKTSLESINEIEIEYQDLFPDNPVFPLLEIITLDKNNLTKKILHFQKNPFGVELLDISSASWVEKNNLYLVRRSLGIKLKPLWHYSQHIQQTVLQRPLKKNLHSFDIIDLVLDEKITEKQMERIICNFRILDSKSGREHIIPHAHFDPVFIKTQDKTIIRYKVNSFMQQANLNFERKSHGLYLKEFIIFLPGSVEEVVHIGLIKSILFLKQRNEMTNHMPDEVQQSKNNTTLDHKSALPKLKTFKSNIFLHYLETQTLPRDSKRLVIKLPEINNIINDGKNLESINLFIRPTNPNVKSGFRLQRARKIIRNEKKFTPIFTANTNNFRQWEGPFTNLNPIIDSTTDGQFSFISLIYKLALISMIALIVIWMCVKGRQITKQNWFIKNTVSINQYRQQLFVLLVKIKPSRNQITLLNRLFGIALTGLALGMIISNKVYAEYIIFISTILLILGVFLNEFKLKNKNLKNLPLVLMGSCTIFLWFAWLLVYSNQSASRFIVPLLVLAYFCIPWFFKLFSSFFNTQKNPAPFWLTAAGTIYLIASILLIGGGSFNSFMNTLSIGHLAIVPYWGYTMLSIKERVEYHSPSFAGIVYDSKENIYVTGFFIFVLTVTLFRIIDLTILAEQFAIIAFYLLVTGVTLNIKTLFKPKTTPQMNSSDL